MLEKYGIEKPKFDGAAPTVVIGMSGGVDSSVAAYILKWQGYNVVGLFMKNWEEKDASGLCTSEADFADVKRVAELLDIPYYAVNFSKQYMENVFEQFLDGLKKGWTPNPDILCNREIKFGPFLQHAKKMGADYIATGHYCRCSTDGKKYILKKGIDEGKDQSYFLCGLSQQQLSRVLFPVGGLKKEQVREIAATLGLSTAKKKDSTGICFIGERNFRNFMKTYLGNQGGEIRTHTEQVVGHHEGLMYYTLGQRKGLGIGGTSENTDRWFVVRKDLEKNVLYVNNGECEELFTVKLFAEGFNFIPDETSAHNFLTRGSKVCAKTRYRQPDQSCDVKILGEGRIEVKFNKPQRAVTPGQWVVLYDGENCLGGGMISPEQSLTGGGI